MSRPKKEQEEKNIKGIGYKIKLYPSKELESEFRRYFGASRYIYNLGIHLEEEHYKRYKEGLEKRSLMSFFDLQNILSELKKTEEYSWLNDFDNYLKYIFHDVLNAYNRYFKGLCNHPKYHKKKFSHQMFAVRSDRLSIMEDTVRLPSIGIVSCDRHNHPEIIGNGNKNKLNSIYKHYYNSRVIFDGCDYWLSFTLEESQEERIEANSCKRFKNNEIWQHKETSEGIGIDWGSKKSNWFVDSRGVRIKQPDVSKEERKVKKYQRKLARQQRVNDEKFRMGKKINSTITEENAYVKRSGKVIRPYTKREEDTLKKLNKAKKRITNMKLAVVHDYTCDLLSEKPEYVNMEDLQVSDMLYSKEDSDISYTHRQRHNKKIEDAMYYTSMEIIRYKCEKNGIPFNLVAKDYPSTQLCSCCGHRQKIGINKTYKCPVCGLVIDRDLNAAYNIRDYIYTASPMEIDYNVLTTELYA